MAKEALRQGFRAIGVRWWESPTPPDSHGEFGLVSAFSGDLARQNALRDWLAQAGEVEAIAAAVAIPPIGDVTALNLEHYVRLVLFDRIQQVLANPELIGDGVAERLAEGAILPMFGMPSRVRLLYHHYFQRPLMRSIATST